MAKAAHREIRGEIKQFLLSADEDDKRRLELQQIQARVDKTRLEIEKLKNGDGDTEDDLIEDWVKEVDSGD
ncbi:hypothetical protein [Paenibacillus polysaccharolyticus]|uniref:hypothetical protein n=1 Tax=Paenibacillus polysaccharolyticus TaxID=582692 RepID=UPI00280ACCE9|nr:hypothetical protein [Paenibacillus polysaccharolyticus]